jgi:hypothetical protein
MTATTGIRRTFRAIVDILIVLSVAATLIEEASVVTGAPWVARSATQVACVVLDLFFVLEFALRLGRAAVDRRTGAWFRKDSGWIDFLAAVFPLVFISGPFLVDWLVGLSTTSLIAAMGNFRLLRGLGLLRLFRLLRLFDADSPAKETGRAALRAGSFALCASLLVLVGAEAASILGLWPDAHEALQRKRLVTAAALSAAPGADAAEEIAFVDSDLLLVRSRGTVIFTRYSAEEFRRRFGPDEIGYLRADGDLEAFFSLSDELRAQAAATLAAGVCAIAVLASIALAFSSRKAPSEGGANPEAIPGGDGSP